MTESLFSESVISILVFQLSFGSKDESYWLGVRDALRMIDSFLKWKNRNPDKAKPLDQFMHEALIAAAKRCESCLSHALGIGFSSTGQDEPSRKEGSGVDFFEKTDSMVERSPLARTLTDPDDLYFEETPPEDDHIAETSGQEDYVPPEEVTLPDSPLLAEEEGEEGTEEELTEPAFDDVESASIDYIERSSEDTTREPEFTEDRDFSKEFELSEPEPLVVDRAESEADAESDPEAVSKGDASIDQDSFQVDIEPSPSESESPAVEWEESEAEEPSEEEDSRLTGALDRLERDFSSHGMDISPRPSEEDSAQDMEAEGEAAQEEVVEDMEDDDDSFTWGEYERAVMLGIAEDEDIEPDEDVPGTTDLDEEDLKPPAEADEDEASSDELERDEPSLWTPYDEPSSIEPEDEEDLTETKEEDTEEEGDEEESESGKTKAPPPPPPPESDESEEERRRRARRLFFGA